MLKIKYGNKPILDDNDRCYQEIIHTCRIQFISFYQQQQQQRLRNFTNCGNRLDGAVNKWDGNDKNEWNKKGVLTDFKSWK